MDEIDPVLDDQIEEPEAVEPEPAPEPKPQPKPQAERPQETPEARVARLIRELDRAKRQAGIEDEQPVPSKKDETGELEALLLEVKQVTHPDDIALFEKWKDDTGRNARQILSSEIFLKELEAARQARAVADATPSGTKRAGGASDDVATALARFESTNELPNDFELRAKVVDAFVARNNSNKPSWKS